MSDAEVNIVDFYCPECKITWIVEDNAPVIITEEGLISEGVLVAYKCDKCGTEIRRDNDGKS